MNCSACLAPVFQGDIFCVACGTRAPGGATAPGPTRAMAAIATAGSASKAPCLGCRAEVSPEDRFCQFCGHAQGLVLLTAPAAPPGSADVSCPSCRASLFDDDVFCVDCGTRVAAGSPPGPAKACTRVLAAINTGQASITPPCPSCGVATVIGDAFCQRCGHGMAPANVRTEELVCPGCGDSLCPDEVFCVGCGTRVGQAAPAGPGAAGRGGTRIMAALAGGLTTITPPCPHCGTPTVPGDPFCGACGTQVAEPAGRPGPERAKRSSGAGLAEIVLGKKDAADHAWDEVRRKLERATIGEYDIARELGRGGMAAVFLAHDVALNRKVAIKVMAPGLLMGKGMVERFSREAQTVANLSHPNIIQIYTVRHADDLHFFVMKYLEGNSLQSVLEATGPLPLEIIRQVLYQIGSGLAYAHKRGIVHRDIKPANILIDTDGSAVVMDFGIAKVAEPGATGQSGMTQAGTVVGTPAYMSPEQCYSAEVTWAADQYSLGVVGYEMMTGRTPFDGTPFEVMQAHTQEPPPRVRPVRSDCPAAVETALLTMLEKKAADRHPTMAAALDALGAEPAPAGDPVHQAMAALAKVETDPARAGQPRTPRSPLPGVRRRIDRGTRRGVPVGAWVGGAAVVALAATAYVLTRGPSPAGPAADSLPAATVAPVVDGQQETAGILVTAPRKSALTVSTPKRDLAIGERLTLAALLTDSAGKPDPKAAFAWTSANPAIADVDRAGAVVAKQAGRVRITATSGKQTGTVDLTVRGPLATAITLFAPSGQLTAGRTARVRIQVDWQGGVIGRAGAVRWKTSDPAVAAVTAADSAGATVSLLKEGDVTVMAELGAVKGTTGLQVRGAATVTLDLSRAAVTFESVPDGPPADQAVTVAVRGTEDAPVAGKVEFTGAAGWLTAQIQGALLTFHVTPKGLAAESYRAVVPVSAGGVTRSVNVTLTIAAPAANAAADLEKTREELQGVLDRYAKALVAKDTAAIRGLFPSTADRDLRDLLKSKLADGFEIQLRRNASIDPGAQAGTLQAEVSAGVLTGGGANFQRLMYTFVRSGGGWRIAGVRPVR